MVDSYKEIISNHITSKCPEVIRCYHISNDYGNVLYFAFEYSFNVWGYSNEDRDKLKGLIRDELTYLLAMLGFWENEYYVLVNLC